ncbi:MAG: hypothetical protein ACK58N_13770 [Synechocystis sp.]|jgi:hypothetical protein
MSWDDTFKLASAILASLGGGAVIVLGFSSLLGKIFSERLLEAYKGKNQRQLEQLKSEFLSDVERLKSELLLNLEISKRFSEKQFYLYNELWSSLCDLKIAGNNLWESASKLNLIEFSEQLRKTEDQILRSSLLIDDQHYEILRRLLDKFSGFEFGKTRLRDLRSTRNGGRGTQNEDLTTQNIERTIQNNEAIKDEYSQLLMEIEGYFKNQIRGIR